MYSWKSNGAGVSWELALHLYEPRLVWAKRNEKTKTNDRQNFVEAGGLRDQIPAGKLRKGSQPVWNVETTGRSETGNRPAINQ